ncbi:MAG: hypothetical protein SFV32_02230 [Opitutaceae bacterium]|nr:hypothetical protein [Opitutaceae bacterium]
MKQLAILLSAVALLASGCNTVEKRIEEKSAVFNSLPPEDQQSLREGHVRVGYTEEMAYIALGKPDEVSETTTAEGKITVWTYLEYSQEYVGERHMGYRRQVLVDRKTGRAYVIARPVHASVYRDKVEDALRLEFKDGKITAIEQPATKH